MGWIVLVLLLVLCATIYLYFLAIKQVNSAVNFLLLVLLSDANYRVHHDSVIFLASDVRANSAVELSMKITTLFRKLIFDSDSNKTFATVTDRLWHLKTAMQPGAANNPSTGG